MEHSVTLATAIVAGGISLLSLVITTFRDRRLRRTEADLNEVQAYGQMVESYRKEVETSKSLLIEVQAELLRLKRWRERVEEWIRGLPPEIRATAPREFDHLMEDIRADPD